MKKGKRKNLRRKKSKVLIGIASLCALLIGGGLYFLGILPLQGDWYTEEDFGIKRVVSPVDYNQNGEDDYTDILLGARADAEKHPKYDGSYYAGGYPPDDVGVCTDVIWRAFRQAGYSLKDMVDQDIQRRPQAYESISVPDPNIDFRRVSTLLTFFSAYGQELTTDRRQVDQWQPGDIVFFNGRQHVGIVSDRRNQQGQPYIIHNGGQWKREEDFLRYASQEVTAHYRFNSAIIEETVLLPWEQQEGAKESQ